MFSLLNFLFSIVNLSVTGITALRTTVPPRLRAALAIAAPTSRIASATTTTTTTTTTNYETTRAMNVTLSCDAALVEHDEAGKE